MFKPTPTWPNVDFRQLCMWIEQSHNIIWPFRLNITFGCLQKLNPGYEICIKWIYPVWSESIQWSNSLIPSLNSRSLPFVVFLCGFPSRCQYLSSGAIRPGGLLLILFSSNEVLPKFIASSSFFVVNPILSLNMKVWNNSKGHFQGPKGPIWTFVIHFS